MADLNSMNDQEFVEYLRSNLYIEEGNYSLEVRLSVARQIFKLFKLVENKEQLAYIVCNKHRIITEACAGAGKTRTSLIKVILHIMFGDVPAESVTLLTYTKSSANDLKYQFENIRRVLSSVDLNGLILAEDLTIKTMHSFFDELIYEYADAYGINHDSRGLRVLNDKERIAIMKDVVTTLVDKQKIDVNVYEGLYKNLLNLYTQIKEKDIMDKPEFWSQCSSFKSVHDIYVVDLNQIFTVYEKLKKARKVIELVEYASVAKVILANPDIRHRWQYRNKMVLVDEFQDITQSQVEVLKLLFRQDEASQNYLLAIGDGDQSIYAFRGAHSNGCYNFPLDFCPRGEDFARCYMTLNRRCPENILNTARKIIETLNVRTEKELRAMKKGGYVSTRFVKSEEDEVETVKNILSQIPIEDLPNTVIAYRNNRSSRLIKRELESDGYSIDTHGEYSDMFETSLVNALNMLSEPYNLHYMKLSLFKLIPKTKDFTRKEILELIKDETLNRENGKSPQPFYSLNYTKFNIPSTLRDVMKALRNISMCMRGEVSEDYKRLTYMDTITDAVVNSYLRPYYLEWQDSKTDYEGSERLFDYKTGGFSDPYAQEVYDYYSQHITWRELERRIKQREEDIKNSFKKVHMRTFHSLKGLEYKNVILVDLRDNVFPGYELEEATKFGPAFIKSADDEAKRLFYVAITRAKENLWMLFRSSNPTRYISYLNDEEQIDSTDKNDDFFDFDLSDEEEVIVQTSEFSNYGGITLEDDKDDEPIEIVRKTMLNRWLDNEI